MNNSGTSSSLPYIGSKISLITTYDIRYEGILTSLNQKESTIAVQNVRSFGTEGRKEPEVPMSNEIYDYIVFSGKDLKDLTVIQEQKEEKSEKRRPPQAQPTQPPVNNAPPPVQSNNPINSQKQSWESKGYSTGAPNRDKFMPYNYQSGDGYAGPQKPPSVSNNSSTNSKPESREVKESNSPRFDSPYKLPPTTPPPRSFQNGSVSPDSREQNNNYNGRENNKNGAAGYGGYNGYNPNHSYNSGKGGYSDMRSESSYGKKGYNKGYEKGYGAYTYNKEYGYNSKGYSKSGVSTSTSNDRSGGSRKRLVDVFPGHPATEKFLVDAIRKKTAVVLEADQLRATSESSESLYHFFLDFLNYVLPKDQANVEEAAQWEAFSRALKQHFESECRLYPMITHTEMNVNDVFKSEVGNTTSQQAQQAWGAPKNTSVRPHAEQVKSAEVGGRPGLTLGDFAIAEATKKTKPSTAKKVVMGARVAAAPKVEPAVTEYHNAEWICPRCTLKNCADAATCGACGFTKDQAKLMDEFPPLGAVKK